MADRRRSISNPLALAVSSHERPMHPYEMASTMRERGKEQSIKLNYGSLYTVVDNLAKHGLIEAMEARREGKRPERTVYQLTDTGRIKLDAWMSELLSTPVKEYPQFEAALSLMPVLHPDHVLDLLRVRVRSLEKQIGEEQDHARAARKAGLPRLLLSRANTTWYCGRPSWPGCSDLVDDLEAGTLEGQDGWRQVYETGQPPDWAWIPPPWTRSRSGWREAGSRADHDANGPRHGAVTPGRGPRPPNRSRGSETRSSEHLQEYLAAPSRTGAHTNHQGESHHDHGYRHVGARPHGRGARH